MNTLPPFLHSGPINAVRRGYLAKTWLPSYQKELAATDRLRNLTWKRKPGPDKDALLVGYFAAMRELEKTLEYAIQVGGLPLMWEGSKALQGGAA